MNQVVVVNKPHPSRGISRESKGAKSAHILQRKMVKASAVDGMNSVRVDWLECVPCLPIGMDSMPQPGSRSPTGIAQERGNPCSPSLRSLGGTICRDQQRIEIQPTSKDSATIRCKKTNGCRLASRLTCLGPLFTTLPCVVQAGIEEEGG